MGSREMRFDQCVDWEEEQGKETRDQVHLPGTGIDLGLNRGRIWPETKDMRA